METLNQNTLIDLATTPLTPQEKFISKLQNDNVFIPSEKVNTKLITGLETRKGLESAIISNGKIVNFVSNGYGHLPNEVFFKEVERKLNEAGLKYVNRSINRNDSSFVVDYILHDPKYVTKVKNGNDIIMPMLRFTNSYDGSNKTSGHFGFFRQVCANGLHVAQTEIGFSAKHRGNILEVVMPEISLLTEKFMDNEFYTISRKFEVLAETYITDLKGFVKATAEHLNMFKFEKSDKNAEPSLNAQLVIDIMNKENDLLGGGISLWHGYNAFNEVLHTKLKKSFDAQKNIDAKLFEHIMQLA